MFVGLTVTPGDESLNALQDALRQKGYRVLDMTDNETAKLHLRHMVGGRLSKDISDEMVFRVEFPERPGSLLQFLTVLGNEYSISLFHYRNHGAAFGRILVGMQVPEGKRAGLRKALNRLGYRFWEETDNPAYREYLGPGANLKPVVLKDSPPRRGVSGIQPNKVRPSSLRKPSSR